MITRTIIIVFVLGVCTGVVGGARPVHYSYRQQIYQLIRMIMEKIKEQDFEAWAKQRAQEENEIQADRFACGGWRCIGGHHE